MPTGESWRSAGPAAPAREGIIPDMITNWFIPAILPRGAGRAMVINGHMQPKDNPAFSGGSGGGEEYPKGAPKCPNLRLRQIDCIPSHSTVGAVFDGWRLKAVAVIIWDPQGRSAVRSPSREASRWSQRSAGLGWRPWSGSFRTEGAFCSHPFCPGRRRTPEASPPDRPVQPKVYTVRVLQIGKNSCSRCLDMTWRGLKFNA